MFRVWAVSAGRQPPAAPPLLRRRLSAPESGRRFQERENTPAIVPHEKCFLYFFIKVRDSHNPIFRFCMRCILLCAASVYTIQYWAQCFFCVVVYLPQKAWGFSKSQTSHDVYFFTFCFKIIDVTQKKIWSREPAAKNFMRNDEQQISIS